MSKKIKILFIYDEMRTFIKKDLDILQEVFDVKTLRYKNKKDIPKLLWGILTTDINFSWFALGYATTAVLFSKLFGKKSIVMAGGWDVVSMPEIGYGAMQSPERRRLTKFTLKYADKVIAVSESTKKNVLDWVPDSNVETIYLGFEPSKFKAKDKEDLVISVGTSAWFTLKVNGYENFIKSAKYLPDIHFMLIGPHLDDSISYLRSISSPNVEFIGYTPFEKLLDYFGRAKVYVLVSAQESFGSALAEAMLCECVPVVTNIGAIPEVVGNQGFYVPFGDTEKTAQKIKEALQSGKGKTARDRIKTLFLLEKRKEKLKRIIDEIL